MRARLQQLSLARQLFALQVVVALVLVAAGAGLAYADARRDGERTTTTQVFDVARSIVDSGVVQAALAAPDPSGVLQPAAEAVRRDTGVDFVTIMRPDRTRLTHPDPTLIGKPFVGTIAPALAGRSFTETYTGTLGPSVRAVVPALSSSGRVVALVAVGVTRSAVSEDLRDQLVPVLVAAVLALLLAALGAWLVSRRLRRQTLGLGPGEITRMYEAHDAVLHAVREGLLVVGPDRVLQLANDEAVRLLDLPAAAEGRPVSSLGLPPDLAALLESGEPVHGETHLTRDRVLLVEQAPATRDGRVLGTVMTLRDRTELKALTGELDSVRNLAEALRSQQHEAANRLHTVITLVELGRPEQAVELAVAELAATQALADQLQSAVEEPALVALLLGKAAAASERGVELVIDPRSALTSTSLEPRELVTLVGNLLDNALDAALAGELPRRVTVSVQGPPLLVSVSDSGSGPASPERVFDRNWSTKGTGRGLGLALVRQVAERHGGTVTVEGSTFTVRLPA